MAYIPVQLLVQYRHNMGGGVYSCHGMHAVVVAYTGVYDTTIDKTLASPMPGRSTPGFDACTNIVDGGVGIILRASMDRVEPNVI